MYEIDGLEMSMRAAKALISAGITSIDSLVNCDLEKLRQLKNIGAKTYSEIVSVIVDIMKKQNVDAPCVRVESDGSGYKTIYILVDKNGNPIEATQASQGPDGCSFRVINFDEFKSVDRHVYVPGIKLCDYQSNMDALRSFMVGDPIRVKDKDICRRFPSPTVNTPQRSTIFRMTEALKDDIEVK